MEMGPNVAFNELVARLATAKFENEVLRGRLKRSARAVRAQCNYLGVWP